ncbi:GTP cyclohydrolase [Paramyrothecium foliicola]|nr:GTP cyclohydrolase [Paramyrothecium foliicola]
MDTSVQQPEMERTMREMQQTQTQLLATIEALSAKLDSVLQSPFAANVPSNATETLKLEKGSEPLVATLDTPTGNYSQESSSQANSTIDPSHGSTTKGSPYTSRIILTTYPKQTGINPLPLRWGHPDVQQRGPVVVLRSPSTIRRRNAVGAAQIGPFPQWSDPKKIVAMDPWGHLAPWVFKNIAEQDSIDIRPTIAITRAHMKLPELEESVKAGRLVPDGKVCLNEMGELSVTKFAVEPVWYLPGVAERFGIDEATLRRSLFEHTGGSYPELITRGDIKVFLPPIGGLTVYCFGDPAKMSDTSVRLSLRIHDECNGSDVFGSDICTCRPYLIFGIEEAVKEAQNGGSGVVIYFRKEGRALGEVTKRGADRASDYFRRTENIAGVKDMRFQALMPDILHWLGIRKIDRMLSMSNIPIFERVELPEELIPADSRVEIDAKITAGYFTAGKRMTAEELQTVQGRIWEDIDH